MTPIPLLATAALLSCGEGQDIISRIPVHSVTRQEYKEIVREVRRYSPNRCSFVVKPKIYWQRPRYARNHWLYNPNYPFYNHPGVRPGFRVPPLVVTPLNGITMQFRF